MGVPFNELNRVLDLGLKPLPWGNSGFLRSNLRKLGDGPVTAPANGTGASCNASHCCCNNEYSRDGPFD